MQRGGKLQNASSFRVCVRVVAAWSSKVGGNAISQVAWIIHPPATAAAGESYWKHSDGHSVVGWDVNWARTENERHQKLMSSLQINDLWRTEKQVVSYLAPWPPCQNWLLWVVNLLNCKQNKSRQLCRTSKKLNLISLHFWTHLWIKSCQVGSQVQNEVFNKWVLFPVKSTNNRNLCECSFLNKIDFKVCSHQKIAYHSVIDAL